MCVCVCVVTVVLAAAAVVLYLLASLVYTIYKVSFSHSSFSFPQQQAPVLTGTANL